MAAMNIGALANIAIVFVVVTVVLGFGMSLLSDVEGGYTAKSYAANASIAGQAALGIFSGKLGLIALAVVLGIVVSVLFGLFMSRR